MEEPHVNPRTKPSSPPRRKPPLSVTPGLWTRLPAAHQQQLRDLLGELVARLHEASRLKEAGHE